MTARRPQRPPTIHDVARATGLSIATVSRAFNYPELLSPETRDVVNAAVQALGYRPQVAAQRLRGTATNLVLVAVPSLNPYFLDIFAGAEKVASAEGYGVLVGHTDREPARERALVDQVAAGRADGLILVTARGSYGDDAGRLPPMVIALDVGEAGHLPAVRIDHVGAAAKITRYLVEIGHRRIAHITGAARSTMTCHRRDGYRQALEASGIPFDPALCIAGDYTVEGGAAAAAAIMAMADPPTAVFAANDQTAVGALKEFGARGWRVPQDISVVGFDDQRLAALASPALTTVHVPTCEIGEYAMQQMIRQLRGVPAERDIVLDTELVIRRSAGPPPEGRTPPRKARRKPALA